jgi:pre-rRNA-processing protein TSR3
MRSSESRPALPSRAALWVVLAGEDNPKACTGRKAIRLGLAAEATSRHRPEKTALLLDPYESQPLMRLDARSAEDGGIVAVDCSWNRLSSKGEYPTGVRWLSAMGNRRRLPLLLAANPQHYGVMGELNTAEALGASLYVIFGRESAEPFLERFSFGRSFVELNGERLESYYQAKDVGEIEELEKKWFG